jgi:uncharacterized protein YehS (DUF1456 family)
MNLEKYPLETESKELLYTRLMEECSEVAVEAALIAKYCSKSLRFGFKEFDHVDMLAALEGLESEMKDVKLIAAEVKRRWDNNE